MIYEYRAYYVMPGRMPDIQRRFAEESRAGHLERLVSDEDDQQADGHL